MKKLTIILTIVAATAMIFSSCGKYEEGPAVSILTKKARVTGTWKMTEITTNGVVYTQNDNETWTFKRDGTGNYTETDGAYSESTIFEWEFNDAKESIIVTVTYDNTFHLTEWKIARLTNKELWITDTETYGGFVYETITKFEKE
ncbi:MAG: lipocalin family protein [Bacteroidales bacterium]|nr:lipocalin family protein [Bacteroidales bacterium]